MPPRRSRSTGESAETPVTDFRYPTEHRVDIPPAGVGIQGRVQEEPKIRYQYDPHRTPVLRFNEEIGDHKALLEKAVRGGLTKEEAAKLAALIESPQPWLEWAGKREAADFEVDPVALHIHERVSAQAILKAARREDIQKDLFAEEKAPTDGARGYYQHDVGWSNRLILGDSLQVMSSLARREGLAGKVQMVYLDPPYGIKFSSNWQNEVGNSVVKEGDEYLSREPEMIRAYRDTWTLGVHSYLAYLKQRLITSHELLSDSGSVFVQISDENVHRVRNLLEEVFGSENFVAEIATIKTSGKASGLIDSIYDIVLWFAKDIKKLKYRQLYSVKMLGEEGTTQYINCRNELTGFERRLREDEYKSSIDAPLRVFAADNLSSQSGSESTTQAFEFFGKSIKPTKGGWKTNQIGLKRLYKSERIKLLGNSPMYRRFLDDFPVSPINNLWKDVLMTGFSDEKRYVVQTSPKIIERCVLMSTDPGDLVVDPTCGSGTTAFVCEEWGRRWITIDTSRVAASIARQRLLTSSFDSYKTKDPSAGVDPNQPQNPRFGFICKSVPHVMLKSIATNKGLDPIFEKHDPILANALEALNHSLCEVNDSLREKLVAKLINKVRTKGEKHTDADLRRWLLPDTKESLITQQQGGPTAPQVKKLRESIPTGSTWQEWEVPFDTDPDWPKALQEALTAYRTAWRAKMDEVNAAISANADQEELVDQPQVVRGVVRVSGPFTVESVRPMEESPSFEGSDESPIGGAPEELETGFATHDQDRAITASNAASHIDRMIALMKSDGVTFLGNKHIRFDRLDPLDSPGIHAEGEVKGEGGEPRRIAVVIGPELGAMPRITAEEAIDLAKARRYDEVILAAFAFDASAQAHVQDQNEKRAIRLKDSGKWKPEEVGPQVSMALIRPDVVLGDLLKGNQTTDTARSEQLSQQIFTVFGQPRTSIEVDQEGLCTVTMEGVDIYDPVTNAIIPTNAGKVAAWFLDTDYDGKTFCICQAFFPDKSAWDKLASAFKAEIPEETWEALSGTDSLPFHPGANKTVAVKVIDPRGNEVIRVHRLS
jgi:adenine-specific DNA-methyltransferase